MTQEITREIAQKVLDTVDAGLCSGKGRPEPGHMCVEAAVCYALGLPHSDNPPCVAAAVRSFKIRLNDSAWSSDQARARGMRRVAIAQLGSTKIDQQKFAEIVSIQTVKQILPPILRRVGLEKNATECANVETLIQAKTASAAAAAAADAADADAARYAGPARSAAAAAAAVAAVATDAARYAADAYAAAAAAARYAAAAARYAAAAADAAAAAARYADEILSMAAEIAVQALIQCGSEGVAFLDLCG